MSVRLSVIIADRSIASLPMVHTATQAVSFGLMQEPEMVD